MKTLKAAFDATSLFVHVKYAYDYSVTHTFKKATLLDYCRFKRRLTDCVRHTTTYYYLFRTIYRPIGYVIIMSALI